MKTIIALLFASTFAFNATATDFNVTLSTLGETKSGMFMSAEKYVARESVLSYELIPATTEVRGILLQESGKNRTCQFGIIVEGSILSRTTELDHENHRDTIEFVRLFVRKVSGCSASQ